nr:hypothetical protein [Xanthomonas arboricola]
MRRHAIQSLLVFPGLDCDEFRQRFGRDCLEALPQLQELLALGLAQRHGALLALTAAGMERADTIGPWLTSAPIVERMQQYQVG